LAKVERSLAKDAPAKSEPPKTVDRAIPIIVFALATVIFAFGFQLHFFFNSAPRFKQFTSDVSTLMPVFWVGFSVGMFPASLVTKRWGGLPVMGLFGFIGAIAIVVMEFSGTLEVVVAAQLIAGAAWGCILMSAFSAAAALGYTGAEGKTTGVLFSALALATFTRMATTASGALNNPSLAPLLHWAPVVCWVVGGVVLVALSIAQMRQKAGVATGQTSAS
jgi:MFS family permease